ncbi:MAG: spore cortex-lytic enzyme [Clostridia bacterium]|nr:spore cortex-lytic enzyme [Clostridia bacterium]
MRKVKYIVLFTIIFSIIVSAFYVGTPFITSISSRLGPGSEGEEVSQLQQRLKNWGYFQGEVNGIYDNKTTEAVKWFQKKYDLLSNGIATSDTLMTMGLTQISNSGAAYAARKPSNEQLLARAINGEARGEPYVGQVAVGAVILNRTRDSKFPKTIAGVIYQPGAFTAVSDGQINVPIDAKSTVVKAARDALNGWDPTNGCLYYWNPATATSKWIWSRKIIKKIGKHNFGK